MTSNETIAAAIDQHIETLDLAMLASVSNMITGGSLRSDDARKILRMAAESAMRTPGMEVTVAGLRAFYANNQLILGIAGNITKFLV